MQLLCVNGPCRISGEVCISGAKNAVLPILAASILCREPVILHNCPDLSDVTHTVQMLDNLGCRIKRQNDTLYIDSSEITADCPGRENAGKMRASVLLLGALLARTNCAQLALPGGCPLGARPIDLHLDALRKLGAQIKQMDTMLLAECSRFVGCRINLPYPSVGATENVLLAAVTAEGTTELYGAAIEPEIDDLIAFLNAAGAKIRREGRHFTIVGVKKLHSVQYKIMPDRIETATFLCAAAGCGGKMTVQNTKPEYIKPVLRILREAGCEIKSDRSAITIHADGKLQMPEYIETAPYPAFPTDAQALITAAFLKAQGQMILRETVFENRFLHIAQMQKLGAELYVQDDCVFLTGTDRLHGSIVTAKDLRAGAALTIAAMQAEGRSVIFGAEHLMRGYEAFAEKFRQLGCSIHFAKIKRSACII